MIKPLSKSVCITPAAFGAVNPSFIVHALISLGPAAAGPNEIRAWTIKDGFTAPNAAGVIHTDFERGFIKAEVLDFKDYITNGGELGAKESGKLRLEGKEYLVKDGDVIHFNFNV